MLETKWFRIFKGDRNLLPRSEAQGQVLARKVLAPLQAQISVFSGKRDAGLATLQEFVSALADGKPVVCGECNRDIFKDGHQESCEIVIQYLEVIGE